MEIFIRRYDRKVYCSKCGKLVLADEYNMKKHAEKCLFENNENPIVVTEWKSLLYTAEGDESSGKIKLKVYVPVLKIHPAFPDRFEKGEELLVYTCEFKVGSKEIKEAGHHNIYYWIERMDEMNCLSEYTLKGIIGRIFPVPAIKDLKSFFRLYNVKGFEPNEKTDEKVLEKYYEYNGLDLKTATQIVDAGTGGRVYFRIEVSVLEGAKKDEPVLRIDVYQYSWMRIIRRDSKMIGQMLITKQGFYQNGRIPFMKLMEGNNQTIFNQDELQYFDKCYPHYKLWKYMKSGGMNILIPLLSDRIDIYLEMLQKAECITMSEEYIRKELYKDLDENATNLKDAFGLPVKVLKKITEDGLQAEDSIPVLKEVYKKHAAYFEVDRIGSCFVQYLKNNILRLMKKQETEIDGLKGIPFKERQKIGRYLSSKQHALDYQLYVDYLNICKEQKNQETDFYPENLYMAYRTAVAEYAGNGNELLMKKFNYQVNTETYLKLSTENEEDEKYFENEDYIIRLAKTPEDLTVEGRALGHCVGTYVSKVAEGSKKIVFIRKKESVEVAFGTIEVTDGIVKQVKGQHNCRLPEDAQEFVRKWAKRKGLKIQTYDMSA